MIFRGNLLGKRMSPDDEFIFNLEKKLATENLKRRYFESYTKVNEDQNIAPTSVPANNGQDTEMKEEQNHGSTNMKDVEGNL